MVRKTKALVLSFDERKRFADFVVLLVKVKRRVRQNKYKRVKSKSSQKTKLKCEIKKGSYLKRCEPFIFTLLQKLLLPIRQPNFAETQDCYKVA